MGNPVYDTLTRATLLGANNDAREVCGVRYEELAHGARKIVEAASALARARGVDDPLEAVRLAVMMVAKRGDDAATLMVMAAAYDWFQEQP
jgi:hypothetical protein